jgi:hypothetical protein
MRPRTPCAFFFILVPALALLQCVSTSDGVSQTSAQASYFDPNSPDNNESYFAKVSDYFKEIRFPCPESELHEYTATRYIASQPPYAAVYVENRFIGRTNDRDLYFKPGQYVVTFYKSGQQWSEILVFAPGKNGTVVTRKE